MARRRMQANGELRAAGSDFLRNDYHGVEHDEVEPCTMASPPCYPVPAPAVTGVSVVVPRQGVALVVDGVVQDVEPDSIDAVRHQLRPTGGEVVIDYTMRVREKPTFFEEGKTYKGHIGVPARFQADRVKLGNDMVAFGLFSRGPNHQWWGVLSDFDNWEEVAN